LEYSLTFSFCVSPGWVVSKNKILGFMSRRRIDGTYMISDSFLKFPWLQILWHFCRARIAGQYFENFEIKEADWLLVLLSFRTAKSSNENKNKSGY
jgi:hypothetical protein